MFPKRLDPGEAEEIAEARITLTKDGVLEACDPHGCTRAKIPRGSPVYLEPVAPLQRPTRLAACIYVELDPPLSHPGGEATYWLQAPYEVAVTHAGKPVAYVTPLPAKYTLVGDIVGGRICRHHRSQAAEAPRDLEHRPGLAYLAARIRGDPALIPGIGFYAVRTTIYTDSEEHLYYPVIEVTVSPAVAEAKTTNQPPLRGLHVAQRGARRLIFTPVFTTPLPRP